MKALLVIIALVAAGYYGYTHYFADGGSTSGSGYSLKTVETKPIPKKEFYELWTDVALKACDESSSRRSMKPEDCREKVQAQSATCTIKTGHTAPQEIRDQSTSQDLGKSYLECVTPRPVCRGVEIKTEDEARRFCN
jgi:hypothetical protein